jgi:hypothetical protein
MAAGSAGRYQCDDQGDFDDRDGYGQHEGSERFAHAMGNYFGVVNSGEDCADQNGRDAGGEERPRGNLPGQGEYYQAGQRNYECPP